MVRILLVAFLLFPLCAASVHAKETDEEATPITKWIEAENKLLGTLPQQNQKVFFLLRNKHSVIRSIYMVKDDVGIAVKACAKENKEISKPINTRFRAWEKSVMPVLKEAEKHLQQELKDQEAFFVNDYKYVMALNDKAYQFSEKQIKKTPVTSIEACEQLVKSMDRTEDQLVDLLQEILLPEEVIRNRLERAEKNNKS